MPCCIGIIQFQRCRHNVLFKLGCTNNCEELCPPEKQYALVITKHLWLCEDCDERKSNTDLDDRCNKWADLMMDIPECNPRLRLQMEDLIRDRETSEDEVCERQRVQCIEEIQWVAEWTHEYGLMLYEVLFKKTWDPRRAAARIRQLRDLRLWDLLVIKDALRNPKVLFEEQSNETYWYIGEQFDEQYMLRKRLRQPPAPERPPVPLFPWKCTETERQSSETSRTLSDEEEDGDGDVVLKDSEDEQAPTEQLSVTPSSPMQRDDHSVTDDTAGESSKPDHPGGGMEQSDDTFMECD